MPEAGIHISVSAEKLFNIGFVPVTNSLLTTWLVMAALIILSYLVTRKISLVPGYLQSTGEIFIEGLSNFFIAVIHEKNKRFLPLLLTLFLFIISVNWVGLLPGMGSIGLRVVKGGHSEFLPLFRAGTADLNTTLALALIALLVIQYSGFVALGTFYLKKFFNFSSPIGFFVGILELMSEVSRIISFAFRLFGNIFAGEVLLTVIAFLMPVIVPLPFLGMELFVGFIQALVFSMLTGVFLSVATQKTEH